MTQETKAEIPFCCSDMRAVSKTRPCLYFWLSKVELSKEATFNGVKLRGQFLGQDAGEVAGNRGKQASQASTTAETGLRKGNEDNVIIVCIM